VAATGEAKERAFRDKYDRPVMTWDELSPYINQLVNDRARINARSRSILASWSDGVTAQLREDKMREIQYNSRAAERVHERVSRCSERSFGWFGVNSRLVADGLTKNNTTNW